MEKTKISTKAQIERLVDLMDQNPEIGRGIGQFGCSRQDMNNKWAKFAAELNCFGPPTRTGPEWQRVWVHYKANLKRKLAKNKLNLFSTGGGPCLELSLSPTEERVAQLTQVNKSINPTGQVMGIIDLASEDIAPTSDVSTPTGPIQKRAKFVDPKLDMLVEQAKTQTEMLKTWQKIESTQHKMYQLEKKKIDILSKADEEEQELRKVNLEYAKLKLLRLKELGL